jgi:hypothetical protein
MRKPKHAPRKPVEPTLACVRSAVTNGSVLFHGVDHRSAWMRRYRDLIADHVSDLGGIEAMSQSEKILARRCAMIALQCELMEARWSASNGEASERQLATYQTSVNTLRKTLEALGLSRRPRDVTGFDKLIEQVKRSHPDEKVPA